MDSKMLRSTIVAVAAVVLVVFAAVVAVNWKSIANRPASSQEAGEQEGEETSQIGTVIDTTRTPTSYGTQIGNNLKAFEQDATFFDPDTTLLDQISENASRRLSLMVTSVERDLRVYVVDISGKPVTGESFVVTLSGKDEYKDIDQDGMIYIADLAAGDYEVALTQTGEGDYLAPFAPTSIRVRDQVNYQPLTDISYMIYDEDEINAALEDTGEKEAALEGDEAAEPDTMNASAHWGIDVSKWNKNIDWQQVAQAGVEFVIIRCGYRGSATGCLVEDPYFEKNIREAKAAGLKVGVYFFTQAIDVTEAVEEASAVQTLCRDYELDLPAFIDTEGAGGNGRADKLDVLTRTHVVDAFCTTLESAGMRAGVYASCNWFRNNLETDGLGHHYIWLAEYRRMPQYEGKYDMWQYTSKGSVAGINGNVDLNLGYIND